MGPTVPKKKRKQEQRKLWRRQQEARWLAVQGSGRDRAGQQRIIRLINRLASQDRGVRESALAELELAMLLIRAGFQVEFLPESRSKTADLRCVIGAEELIVEVTALVGMVSNTKQPISPRSMHLKFLIEEEEEPEGIRPLIPRLTARIIQKARQLDQYAVPVVLAVTLPMADQSARKQPTIEVDLKRLAGMLTLLLAGLRHISGVLLSLWDVDPLPSTSNIRLANVHVVERSKHQPVYPRVRILVLNPSCHAPLEGAVEEALKSLL